jgi:hypothetical protein
MKTYPYELKLSATEINQQLDSMLQSYLNTGSWTTQEARVITQYAEFLKGIFALYRGGE